jgi:serine/threonine-protein kinase
MPFGKRIWGAGKVLLLIGSLALTFIVFFTIAMRLAVRAGQVQVPDLTGARVEEAAKTLAELGLGLQIDQNRRPDPKVAVDRIMRQDPPGGVEARPQRTVRVWISAGPRITRVPALVGQSERTARIRLEQEGLQLAAVSEIHSTDYPPDSVIAQNPASAARTQNVALLVNRGGPDTFFVTPDVTGLDGARVESVLNAQGLRVAVTGTLSPVPGLPPGTVLRQQPPPGARLAAADIISLEVNR